MMDTNVTVALITGSCTAVVGIAAIVVNTFWVRYALEKIGARLDRFEDRVNTQLDALNGKLSALDLEIAKLMDRSK